MQASIGGNSAMGISLDMDLKVIANWVIRMLLVTS